MSQNNPNKENSLMEVCNCLIPMMRVIWDTVQYTCISSAQYEAKCGLTKCWMDDCATTLQPPTDINPFLSQGE